MPETLLVLQSFVLALAVLPIYKLAKDYAGGKIVGLVFAVAYLMFPAIHFVNLYDFHVQAFLPLFFAYAIYYITKENWPRYFLFVFLSLMCEEHAAQIVFFIGVYIAWKYRARIISAFKRKNLAEKKLLIPFITMILSIVWYWFTIWQRNTFFPTNPETRSVSRLRQFCYFRSKKSLRNTCFNYVETMECCKGLSIRLAPKLFLYSACLWSFSVFFIKSPICLNTHCSLAWFLLSIASSMLSHARSPIRGIYCFFHFCRCNIWA